MKKPLKMRWVLPVALLLALVLVCGTVFAYMFHRTEDKSTTFIPAKVSCEVAETFESNVKSSITVENTGNIDAYLRIRLVTYWIDSDGNVAPKSSPTLTVNCDTTKWIKGSDNTFYYKAPVNPNHVTDNLLNVGTITLEQADGYRQVVDVFAEAIQADPEKAAEKSWNVEITDGKITAVNP